MCFSDKVCLMIPTSFSWKELKINLKSFSITFWTFLFSMLVSFFKKACIPDDSWVSILFLTLSLYFFFFFQAVLKNGVISGSGFMNSGNVRCGNSVCRPISGVFAKNPLPNGYVHVTTIPAGASNITITELRNSINFLGEFSYQHFEILSWNSIASWKKELLDKQKKNGKKENQQI